MVHIDDTESDIRYIDVREDEPFGNSSVYTLQFYKKKIGANIKLVISYEHPSIYFVYIKLLLIHPASKHPNRGSAAADAEKTLPETRRCFSR